MISNTLLTLVNNPDCPNEFIRDQLLEEGIDVATIYVVVGSTGEYSDRSEWNVAAFLDKKAATKLLAKLRQWVKSKGLDQRHSDVYIREQKPPEDPQFYCDYTGTRYDIAEVPLRG